MSNELKINHINLLQKYTSWGKSEDLLEKEAEEIFDAINFIDLSLEELKNTIKIRPKTKLLIGTNIITSPIEMDNQIELPVVELFFNSSNFVVFTTKNIYNCRNSIMDKINYNNIVNINERSLEKFAFNRNIHFMDIELITCGNKEILITIENGIPFGPILNFLTEIIDRK